MRVLLSGYDSRGGVEPLLALAVRLRALDVEVRVGAPPDAEFARRLAEFGVPMTPFDRPARSGPARGARPAMPQRAAQLIASLFDAVTGVAEDCDVLVATGVMPAAAGMRSIAEKLGVRYVYATFKQLALPSPSRSPIAYADRPFPAEMTGNRARWDFDAETIDLLFGAALNTNRAALGLPPVAHVRDYVLTDQPWLATDPTLDPRQDTPGLDVVQTGAWLMPDERPLPPELLAFLAAGTPPVYVGFGSMAVREADLAAVLAAIRAHGRRVIIGSGWAELGVVDDRQDCFVVGEVNQQALFGQVAAAVQHGGAGTTVTAARAGVPQVVLPQGVDQPYWAGRVAELGIGAAHDGPTPTVESLSAALDIALDPETRRRAATVAGMIRTDGAEIAARRLVDLVATTGARGTRCGT